MTRLGTWSSMGSNETPAPLDSKQADRNALNTWKGRTIAAQFPHVASQVVDSEAVCRVRHDWSRLDVAIQFGVGHGNGPSQTLHFTSPLPELTAPWKPDLFPSEVAANSHLPRWASAPPPCRISHGILKRDVHDRMIQHLLKR